MDTGEHRQPHPPAQQPPPSPAEEPAPGEGEAVPGAITMEEYARSVLAPTRPRRVLVRGCDLCRRDCDYLPGPPAAGRTRHRARWVCPEHGERPSPVLLRRPAAGEALWT